MKLCFSTLGCPGRNLDEIISLAKKFGINAVELRGVGDELMPSATPDFAPENTQKTKEKFLRNGIKPISLDLSYSCHAVGKNNDEINALIPELNIAAALDIPYIRVFGNNIIGDRNEAIQNVIYALKGACRLAAERGITVLLEIHGDFNCCENMEPIINAMQGEMSFGIIWDIAHSDVIYGENFEPFYEYIKPFVRHIHIKDHIRSPLTQTEIGRGEVPIKKIVRHLWDDGFDGYFSLEWEKRWHPELSELEFALEDYIELMNSVCKETDKL